MQPCAFQRLVSRASTVRFRSSFKLNSLINRKYINHTHPLSSLQFPPTMPLKVEEADVAADFDALIACQWASFENPHQPFFRLFCPVLGGPGAAARAEALQTSTNNQRDWLNADPTSYWQKVTDTETGEIVGGALWKICPTSPFEVAEEHFEAYWYPEGGQRDFVTKALEQLEEPRAKMGRRPQLCMYLYIPLSLHPYPQHPRRSQHPLYAPLPPPPRRRHLRPRMGDPQSCRAQR